MKHLQADLSTYASKAQQPPPYAKYLVCAYIYSFGEVTTKWFSPTIFTRNVRPLSDFTPIDLNRMRTDFTYYHTHINSYRTSYTVVSLDKLEAYTAYFLEHPSDTSHPLYAQCVDTYPEYFL